MRRLASLLLLLLCGCSTAPLADALDLVKPGRLPPGARYHGGVGSPQPFQPVAPPSTTLGPPASPETIPPGGWASPPPVSGAAPPVPEPAPLR